MSVWKDGNTISCPRCVSVSILYEWCFYSTVSNDDVEVTALKQQPGAVSLETQTFLSRTVEHLKAITKSFSPRE